MSADDKCSGERCGLLSYLDRSKSIKLPSSEAEAEADKERLAQEILSRMTALLLNTQTFTEWKAIMSGAEAKGVVPRAFLNEIVKYGSTLERHLNSLKVKERQDGSSRRKY